MKKIKIIFIIIYMMVSLSFLIIIFKGQKDVMYSENRTAQRIPAFSVNKFLKNDFQNDLEQALSDQFIKGEGLKSVLIGAQNTLHDNIYSSLLYKKRKNAYYSVAQGCMGFDNADYLLYAPMYNVVEREYDIIKTVADSYNRVKNVEKYFYFVNTDQVIDFANVTNDTYNDIVKLYGTFKSDYLEINSFDDYKKYFYKTDHHWNYKGSYQGYVDMINLMLGESEKVKEPKEEKEFDIIFYGSKASRAKFFKYKEKFKVYTFDIPKHKTYINGEEKEYGKSSKYLKGDIDYNENINRYADYYGGDFAEIIYDFKQPNKDNLLIVASSFSNAVNELIASHFNKTYIIDTRHYKNFNIDDYIKKNKIDKFLVITYTAQCKSDDFILGRGE